MPKFKVRVVEEVTMAYDAVEIEAETDNEAQDLAEEMRCSGALGKAQFVSVDDIDYLIDPVAIAAEPA